MTMRKYLVTIHEDGSVMCQEFDEPADQALQNYQAGYRNAVDSILECLERHKLSYDNTARGYSQCGKMHDCYAVEQKYVAICKAIDDVRLKYKVCGTRR